MARGAGTPALARATAEWASRSTAGRHGNFFVCCKSMFRICVNLFCCSGTGEPARATAGQTARERGAGGGGEARAAGTAVGDRWG